MPQKLIDQTTIQPDGSPGDDAFTAFAICNDNAEDTEARLKLLESGGGEIGGRLDDEIAARTAADAALGARIDAEHSLITQETADRIVAVQAEATARASADTALSARILGKNVLINGNMGIWQRATTAASQVNMQRFVADRWFNWSGGGKPIQIDRMSMDNVAWGVGQEQDQPAYAMRVQVGQAGTATDSFALLQQRVEDVRTLAGGKATFSARIFVDVATKIGIGFWQMFGGSSGVDTLAPKIIDLVAGWNKVSVTYDLPTTYNRVRSPGNCLALNIWLASSADPAAGAPGIGLEGFTMWITNVQLEAGPIATAYEYVHPALQLQMCQRYFEKSYNVDTTPGTAAQPGRVNTFYDRTQGQVCTSNIAFQVTKRAVPAVAIYDDLDGTPNRVRCNAGGQGVVNSIPNVGHNNAQLNYTPASGQWGCSFHFTADAELN